MATMVVFAFKDEDSAVQMRDKLVGLQKMQLIQLSDAAVVVRRQDGKVKVKQAVSLVGAGALGGAVAALRLRPLRRGAYLGAAPASARG